MRPSVESPSWWSHHDIVSRAWHERFFRRREFTALHLKWGGVQSASLYVSYKLADRWGRRVVMNNYPNCILATCVVPWQADLNLDQKLFRQQVRLLRQQLTPHLYLFGTAGEGYGVSDEQFQRIVRIFHSEMSGPNDHPMVGIISLSLETVVRRIEFCHSLGIQYIQLSLPCWATLNDREVDTFFAETCGRFSAVRFLHYNLPRAGRLLTGSDYRRLAMAHPNLVAVKDGSTAPEKCLELVQSAPRLRFFLTEARYAAVRDDAECGLLVSVAATNFAKAQQLFAARGESLRRLSEEVDEVHAALIAAVETGAHIDGAFDKLLIRTHMPNFPLRLLPPYETVSEGCAERFLSRLPPDWRRG